MGPLTLEKKEREKGYKSNKEDKRKKQKKDKIKKMAPVSFLLLPKLRSHLTDISPRSGYYTVY